MLSLNGALRTCKVNTGWANRLQSDRFENPNLMVCPTWNGMDNAGRPVTADSFNTKRAGCNSADDRVSVENNLRPQYMEYISLDASGIPRRYTDLPIRLHLMLIFNVVLFKTLIQSLDILVTLVILIKCKVHALSTL